MLIAIGHLDKYGSNTTGSTQKICHEYTLGASHVYKGTAMGRDWQCFQTKIEVWIYPHLRIWKRSGIIRSQMKILVLFLICIVSLTSAGCQVKLLESPPASDSELLQAEPLVEQENEQPSITIPFNNSLTDRSPSATQIFDEISPAVAFVETPTATGSGIWIEPGYLVTNAHVVWPYATVDRVVFPNGEEYKDIPIIVWDLMADLAIVGPIETDIPPLLFTDGSSLEIGNDIFLIGYPGEMEEYPQPTLTQGVLSRIRKWETIDLDFFQVDAAIAGGQSGGVLVTGTGDIVGISTFRFTEAGFGLVASAQDFVTRLEDLLNNPDDASTVNRKILDGSSIKQELVILANDIDVREYILLPITEEGAEVEISITGQQGPNLYIYSLIGYDYITADTDDKTTFATFKPEPGVPYLVQIQHDYMVQGSYQFESNFPLVQLKDPDDDQRLEIAETIAGVLDHADDIDTYEIYLEGGEVVEIEVDSLSINPVLAVSYESALKAEIFEDYDSGGGIFGTNAKLTILVPERGLYTIEVGNTFYGGNVGGYYLSINSTEDESELAEPVAERWFVQSDFGKMARYRSTERDFEMFVPAEWKESFDCGEVTACFTFGGISLTIAEENLGDYGITDMGLEEYVDSVIDNLESFGIQFELESREKLTRMQDLTLEKFTFTVRNGRYKGIRMIYVKDGKQAFNAVFGSEAQYFSELEPYYDYLLSTFRVMDRQWQYQDAIDLVDAGRTLATKTEYSKAIERYSQAIEIDPYHMDAYVERSAIYAELERPNEAIADLANVLTQQAGRHEVRFAKGMLHYSLQDYDASIDELNRAILGKPYNKDYYLTRALVYAARDELNLARKDVDKVIRLSGGATSNNILEVSGYLYLREEDYENAVADYETVLANEIQTPLVLLGAGVAYEAVGKHEEAVNLLESGLELLSQSEPGLPTPQLVDLQSQAESILE